MRAQSAARVGFLLLACGALGGGCGGGGGSGRSITPLPTPAIVGLSPAEAWRDGPVTLTITGTDTNWSADAPPTVELGSDVSIDSVVVDGPTSLRVAARIAYDADLGLRLVLVTVGSVFYATPPFEVKAPIGATWFSQPFVRSSVHVGVILTNRPGDVVDGPVVAVASNGDPLPLYLDDPRAFILVIPEDAPLGPFDLLVHRTGADGASTFRVAAGTIGPRSTVFTEFPMEVEMPTSDGTALHRYTSRTACYLEFPMTSSDPTLPIHFLYAHESPFAPPVVGLAPILYGETEPGPRAIALPGETFDVIVFTGHTSYAIDVVESEAPVVAEVEPNDTPETGQLLSLPAIVAPATTDQPTAEAAPGDDWYRFEIGVSDVDKIVRVLASPGPALTVRVFRSDGGILTSGSSDGAGSAIDIRTAPLEEAGTYFVVVSSIATPSSPDVTDTYRLFVRLEEP